LFSSQILFIYYHIFLLQKQESELLKNAQVEIEFLKKTRAQTLADFVRLEQLNISLEASNRALQSRDHNHSQLNDLEVEKDAEIRQLGARNKYLDNCILSLEKELELQKEECKSTTILEVENTELLTNAKKLANHLQECQDQNHDLVLQMKTISKELEEKINECKANDCFYWKNKELARNTEKLDDQVKSLQSQNKTLNKKIEDLEEKISECETLKNQNLSQIEELKSQSQVCLSENTALTQHVYRTLEELEEGKKKCKEVDSLSSQNTELIKIREELVGQLEACKAQNKHLTMQVDDLANKLSEERHKSGKDTTQDKAQMEGTAREGRKNSNGGENSDEMMNLIKATFSTWGNDIVETRSELEKENKALTETKAKVESEKQRLKDERELWIKARQSFSPIKHERDKLQEQVMQLEFEMNNIKFKVMRDKDEEIKNCNSKLNATLSCVKNLEEQNDSLRQKNEGFEQDIEEVKAKLNDSDRLKNVLSERVLNLEKELIKGALNIW